MTVIIAAYKRAEALNLTIRSILNQDYQNFQVLVVADCCDQTFLNKVDQSDPRVSILNLPVRCGNQYGPNSVGIHLADTDFIAFLNHDDIWLKDHLSNALSQLKESKADFFLGAAAFCHQSKQDLYLDSEKRLLFGEKNKSYAIWACLGNNDPYFEPCSTWVIRSSAAKKVGFWNSPAEVEHNPLVDWLRRASRSDIKFCFSRDVTCLKFNLHHTKSYGGDYSQDNYLEYVGFYIDEEPERTRELIEDDLRKVKERGLFARDTLNKELKLEEEIPEIYNYINFIKSGEGEQSAAPGANIEKFLRIVESRTGEKQESFISSKDLIDLLK